MTIDAAGQITTDGLNTYTWDDAGRLKTVSRGGQLRATYHYDHKHRRTRKVTTAAAPQGAKTLFFHYDDQDRLIAETTETGAPVRSYLWVDATLLAQIEYTLNATTGLYTVSRELLFELDHLGTPRQARLTSGSAVWRWESDGYGTSPANEDPDGNGQKTYVYVRFPGQYYDEESGLHYNWHRYYVPRLGRYLSSDPIGVAGGNNTYTYVYGNPINNADPNGLCPWCAAGLAIGVWANIGVQLTQNGGNWGQLDPWQVALSGLAGAASGGLGTITSSLGVGSNLSANALGSAAISAAQQAASNATNGQCLSDAVVSSAVRGGFFGGIGAAVGSGYNAWRNASNATSFLNTSNSISGPFFPSLSRNWAPGGTVGGNVISNVISNSNQ